MKPLTPKQIKIAWIIGGILVFVHFLPNLLNVARQAFGSPAHRVPQIPPAYVHHVPRAPLPVPSPEVVAARRYGGIWSGNALLPEIDARCEIRLEIRLNADIPQRLKGYESKACMPLKPFPATGYPGNVLRASSPVSSVMTGTPQDSGVKFTIDQTIGTHADGCALTSFDITEFGLGQLQAQWKAGSCPAGNMVLSKVRG